MHQPHATLADQILSYAKQNGATDADVVVAAGESLSLTYRLGKLESLERSEATDIGIRVFIGQKTAIVSTSDANESSLLEAVQRAIATARLVPDDPYVSLASPAMLATTIPELDCCDTTTITPDQLLENCAGAEAAARSVSGITNSEGAQASAGKTHLTLATSAGFCKSYATSGYSLSVSVIAGEGQAMERDDDYTTAAHYADLRKPDSIGLRAAEKAVKRLNPRQVKTGRYPVIFAQECAGSLLRLLTSAINGQAVARGTTFLKDSLGQRILPAGINIIDDPHRQRGLRSRPFDAEGLATEPLTLVDDGVLRAWVLDLATAKQLNMTSNARASRGVASAPAPSVTNVSLTGGKGGLADLMRPLRAGVYITETMGMGVNLITGDYSQGAAGFWIENGTLAYPISGFTIAGRLQDMLASLVPADDAVYKTGIDAPSMLIPEMTVAGD